MEYKPTKDKEGNVTGFEWDPDNAYEDGKLKDGYFEMAITVTDGAKDLDYGQCIKVAGGLKYNEKPVPFTDFIKTYEGLNPKGINIIDIHE